MAPALVALDHQPVRRSGVPASDRAGAVVIGVTVFAGGLFVLLFVAFRLTMLALDREGW